MGLKDQIPTAATAGPNGGGTVSSDALASESPEPEIVVLLLARYRGEYRLSTDHVVTISMSINLSYLSHFTQ